jgi:hypothetical protein
VNYGFYQYFYVTHIVFRKRKRLPMRTRESKDEPRRPMRDSIRIQLSTSLPFTARRHLPPHQEVTALVVVDTALRGDGDQGFWGVMAASIFMNSVVAMVCPATSTVSTTGDDLANGAAT